jgi:vancomycin resistance protein YoaR
VSLAVDVEATVARAASGGRNPFRGLLGARVVDPVVSVDAGLLNEAVRDLAEEAGEAMTMPEIRFEGTEPVPVYPEPGLGLDPERSAAAVAGAWPRLAVSSAPMPSGAETQTAGSWRGPDVIELPLVEITPVTTAEEVDRLLNELARPAVAAPVTVTTPDGGSVEASPEVIAVSLRLTADERGEIVPSVDPEALREGLAGQLRDVETAPVDARVVLDGGSPRIVESTDGELVDHEALAGELLDVLPQPAPRSVTAEMTVAAAEVDEEDVAALGIEEQVSTFTTYFDGGLSSGRSQNIVLAAEMVDGAVVQPGETFSLNEFTGPRGYEQGFQDAPVIIGGRLEPAVGGGLSQFTTTLFNAAYYAGLEDVQHSPHSYYYSRYPAVIEATIFYPTLDMKFRNNTEYGVLIDTSYTDGSLTVSMWSTKVWDEVTTEWGDRRNVTQPRREYLDPGPSCIATVGLEGFTQDAWRVFYKDGSEVNREKFTWRYDAQPEFVCAEEPDEDDDEE